VGLLAVLLATGVLPFLAPGQDTGLYALAAVATAIAFVLSLLAHEVAHTLVALRYGLPVRRITVWLLGGVSESGGRASRPEVEMRVAIAGPLVSLGLGVLFLASALVGGSVSWAALVLAPLTWLGTTNVVIGVFKRRPGPPGFPGRTRTRR
jgi:Zn-dependent protease